MVNFRAPELKKSNYKDADVVCLANAPTEQTKLAATSRKEPVQLNWMKCKNCQGRKRPRQGKPTRRLVPQILEMGHHLSVSLKELREMPLPPPGICFFSNTKCFWAGQPSFLPLRSSCWKQKDSTSHQMTSKTIQFTLLNFFAQSWENLNFVSRCCANTNSG